MAIKDQWFKSIFFDLSCSAQFLLHAGIYCFIMTKPGVIYVVSIRSAARITPSFYNGSSMIDIYFLLTGSPDLWAVFLQTVVEEPKFLLPCCFCLLPSIFHIRLCLSALSHCGGGGGNGGSCGMFSCVQA